jgi:ABC-type spermidine/putrescine transport system permease subunit I
MRARLKAAALLALPLAFLAAFFVLPLIFAVGLSLDFPKFTVQHYQRLIDVPVYRLVYLKTLRVGLVTTGLCLLLGYPCAYFVSRLRGPARTIAVALIALPFMLSVLIRNYVWMLLLQDTGLLNRLLQGMGVTDGPIRLMYNELGVTIAMVNMLVPYIFFPVLGALMAIPPDLKSASANLGANRLRTFVHVTLPLTVNGVLAGCLLTFIVAVGFYITPAMLGGSREMMISNLIAFNVREVLNWPFAFSLATTLLGSTVVLYFIYRAFASTVTVLKAV